METIITDPERNYILKGLTHGTGRISKKPFSIASPAMWNKLLTDELWSCTRIDVLKKHKNHFFKVCLYNFISLLSTCMFSLLLYFCKHPSLRIKFSHTWCLVVGHFGPGTVRTWTTLVFPRKWITLTSRETCWTELLYCQCFAICYSPHQGVRNILLWKWAVRNVLVRNVRLLWCIATFIFWVQYNLLLFSLIQCLKLI